MERAVTKYSGHFKMTSEEYSVALADVSTSTYNTLAKDVRTQVLCVYKSSDIGSIVVDVTSITFSQGSVEVDFMLLLDGSSSNDTLQNVLKDIVERSNGRLGRFSVDASSVAFGPKNTENGTGSSFTAHSSLIFIAAVIAVWVYGYKDSSKVMPI